ncbi:unnamed protein product [Durusdinium trenchii]|uniref:14-3-3 domain-containing protein n=3 Tax=Durusdinium trenchii TaxID=1381693 RepID=A0ABP0R550_9DINO
MEAATRSTVTVVTLSGEPVTLAVPLSSRVADARAMIVERGHLRARRGQLVLGDRTLEDGAEIEKLPSGVDWQLVYGETSREECYKAAVEAEAVAHLEQLGRSGEPSSLTREERDCWARNGKRVLQGLRDAIQAAADADRPALSDDLERVCAQLLEFCHLQSTSASAEDLVCYNRFSGDMYRYLATMGCSKLSAQRVRLAEEAYKTASASTEALSPLNPVRLSLALNFSVFLHEVLQDHDQALQIARESFDDAISFNLGRGEDWELEGYDKGAVSQLLQLLRDNLTLWSEAVGGS